LAVYRKLTRVYLRSHEAVFDAATVLTIANWTIVGGTCNGDAGTGSWTLEQVLDDLSLGRLCYVGSATPVIAITG